MARSRASRLGGGSRDDWTFLRLALGRFPRQTRTPSAYKERLTQLGLFGEVANTLNRSGGTVVRRLLVKGAPSWFSLRRVLRDAGPRADLEVRVFERYGWRPAWCDHGQHFYVADDPRRKDCIRHRYAGQKARWRAPRRKRRIER